MKVLTDPRYCMGVCQMFPENEEDGFLLKRLFKRIESGADVNLESEHSMQKGSLVIYKTDFVEKRKTPVDKSEILALYHEWLKLPCECRVPEVLLTPYNECLVRFMVAKEQADYQERYMNEMNNKTKAKAS